MGEFIMNKKILRIVFSIIISDAGEVTRAIEIADGIRSFVHKIMK